MAQDPDDRAIDCAIDAPPRLVWPWQRWALVWLRATLIWPVPLVLAVVAELSLNMRRDGSGPTLDMLTGLGALYALGGVCAAVLAAIWLAGVMLLARRRGQVGMSSGVVLGCVIASVPLTVLFVVLYRRGVVAGWSPDWRFALAWGGSVVSGGIATLVALWLEKRRQVIEYRPEAFD